MKKIIAGLVSLTLVCSSMGLYAAAVENDRSAADTAIESEWSGVDSAAESEWSEADTEAEEESSEAESITEENYSAADETADSEATEEEPAESAEAETYAAEIAGAAKEDKIDYTVEKDGTITIDSVKTSKTTFKIPEKIDGKTVAAIGGGAFAYQKSIKTVTIPSTVKSIGDNAFNGCTKLSKITIPKSVTEIGQGAFTDTPWLKAQEKANAMVIINNVLYSGKNAKGNITIPASVDTITSNAFSSNKKITGINIPKNVKHIGDFAFFECDNVTKITIANGVKDIGVLTFYNIPKVKTVTVPKSVKSIGDNAIGRAEMNKYSQSSADVNILGAGGPGSENVKNFTLKCYKNTEAEKYALRFDVNYSLLDGSISTPKKVKAKVGYTYINGANIEWDKVSNASGYAVYRYNTSKKKWEKISTVEGSLSGYFDYNVKSGTTYKYKVKAYVRYNGKLYYGKASDTVTLSTLPEKVTMKSAYTSASDSIGISWKTVKGAQGYRVYRYDSASKKWVKISTVKSGSTTTFTDKGLDSGTAYKYKVKAYRKAGGKTYTGEASDIKTCKTK